MRKSLTPGAATEGPPIRRSLRPHRASLRNRREECCLDLAERPAAVHEQRAQVVEWVDARRFARVDLVGDPAGILVPMDTREQEDDLPSRVREAGTRKGRSEAPGGVALFQRAGEAGDAIRADDVTVSELCRDDVPGGRVDDDPPDSHRLIRRKSARAEG